ncbi:MAG: 50S ribosomal protein L25 [Patescibacteria group bacterium]|nr:50S ribosomal protein L25 [Patescibacteria group bacterium]MDE1944329.1 50S ribosomal protein L25 [Patescibacteria group bacterium]MDE2057359.1 50S ribosomal protein L25 [Patescibacteria group bacterium]
MPNLPVAARDSAHTSPKALRRAGKVPAVVYGATQASTPIAVDLAAFAKVLAEAGESSIVTLEGLGAPVPTLIHEVDLDPVTRTPRHVDFYAVTRGQKVEVAIPLEFVGESPAVKAGANLVKVMHELTVEADPMALPHELTFDVSALAEVGQQVRAGDVLLPAGVTLAVDADEIVALIQEVAEEPEEEAAPVDLSTIEVEQKGKEEPAEGEAAE